jgi:FMN phosphatase YigB (HAD superfamily)
MNSGQRPVVSLLVTDLDNTLWDWFEIWHDSFSVLLEGVAERSGVARDVLESEAREIHQRRGTSEYSYLLKELPSLLALHPRDDIPDVYQEEIHNFRSTRKRRTKLYPRVRETLSSVKAAGVAIVAYTESIAFYSAERIKALGLDGLIDVLYSSPDHDFPAGVSRESMRSKPSNQYGVRKTKHRHVPRGILKPDPQVLNQILAEMEVPPAHAAYVGDSLMKDVAMAQAAGALDVLAAYGASHNRDGYALLQRVSHWTAQDVEREREINRRPHTKPTYVLDSGFYELLDLFEFGQL